MAGAPKGNNNANFENRAWRKAVLRHQAQNAEQIAKIVSKQFEKAEEGDIQAFKAITEISDGKPVQQTEITGAGGESLLNNLTVKFVSNDGKP
jgi:hypothetical protein